MHHAVCFVGDVEEAIRKIPDAKRAASPDVSRYTYPNLGIDDARVLTHESLQRPLEGSSRVFILTIGGATTEAQNALLKLFEEPAPGVQFYLIVPREDILIPTLRSRLDIRHVHRDMADDMKIARDFLLLPHARRLALVAEKVKSLDDTWCDSLIRGLEYIARDNPGDSMGHLLAVDSYLKAPGASKKMLLEHLALQL